MLPWQPFWAFYIWGAHWRHLQNMTESSMCGSDAALCQITLTTCYYRPSSVVCRSVCRSVTLVSRAKAAAPIKLPFGLRTWVGPGNHVLDGGLDPPMGRGKFFRENRRPIVEYRDPLRSSVQRRMN